MPTQARRVPWPRYAAALCGPLMLAACASPTEITIDVFTEGGCGSKAETAVTLASSLGALAQAASGSTSLGCRAPGHVGDVVVVPADDRDKLVAFAVTLRLGGEPTDPCLDDPKLPGCILARRQLRFIPNDDLRLRIDLRASCLELGCPATQTCIRGKCVDADVSATCEGYCDESTVLRLPRCPPLASRVRISKVATGAPVGTAILAAAPSYGGSLLAWTDNPGKGTIHLRPLDQNDAAQAEFPPLSGDELLALVAHEGGGAVVTATTEPLIDDHVHCVNNTCKRLEVVRFDASGRPVWPTPTKLTNDTRVDMPGAVFVWGYPHQTRIVWGNNVYGVLSRVAFTGIYAGQILRFVSAGGEVLSTSTQPPCGSSSNTGLELAYSPLGKHFGAACNDERAPQIAMRVLDPPDTSVAAATLHQGLAVKDRTLGGIVPRIDGFWLGHTAPEIKGSSNDDVHLAFVGTDGSVLDKRVYGKAGVDERQPFLADHGPGHMLLGFKVGQTMHLAELDSATGDVVDGPIQVDAAIDAFYQDFVTFSNGDAGWAYAAGSEVDVVRVAACP